ncbi:MAG: alcohol dehydrogenase catalytic domain-containing protein [Actinobacteria bacterium]|nr:alcohol dehydrogenase catalytic domain-containing protein [Actinomycetota bacterium]
MTHPLIHSSNNPIARPSTMRALQLQAINRLVEVQLPVPDPKPDEVLVRTVATTICTSDLNDIAHNPFGIPLPRVMGHEGAGVVAALGDGVTQFRVGERVAAHPVIPCRACENCRRGLGHLCSNLGHLGLDRDGTFAEFFCIRADRARRIAPAVEFAAAALLEPVAVCLEAVRRGRIQPGETVLVVGDGPFGLLIARLASRFEPSIVIVVGRHEFRLRQVPTAIAIHEKRTPDVPRAIREANGGRGVDVAILAAGSPSALELGMACLRARGRVVVFSAVQGTPSVDWFRLHTQELEILGACNDEDLLEAALERLADSELRLSSLVTHRFPFAQWPEAFALARDGHDRALKVALIFPETT